MSNFPLNQDLLRKHPVWVAIGVVSLFIAFGYGAYYLLFELELVSKLVAAGVSADWEHQHVQPKSWFAAFVFLLIFLVVLLVVFLVRALAISKRPKSVLEQELKSLQERNDVAIKTLRGMMEAASRIRQQLFPKNDRPIKNLKLVESTYLIYKNFDVAVTHRYDVAASDRPLHFMEITDGVEDWDDPVEFLDDIQFKVKDGNGKPLAYILSRNDPRHKSAIVYFLPQVAPNEAKPRTVIVTYKWPGMLKQLDKIGREPYAWEMVSKENIPEARFHFYLEPGTGRKLYLEPTGGSDGQQEIDENLKHPTMDDWHGRAFIIKDAPSGTYKLTLYLKKA